MGTPKVRESVAMLSVLVALLSARSAAAQERATRVGGGGGITVFTGKDYHGTSATFHRDMPVLRAVDLNDKIASFRVPAGEQWEVCEHDNYRGRCVVVSADDRDLSRSSFANTISSIRRVRSAAGVIAPPPALPTPLPTDLFVVLFDQTDYHGRSLNYRGAVSHISLTRPLTKSVTIAKGTWEFCDGPSFTGRCLTLSRSTTQFGGATPGFRVRSLRPLSLQPR